jgi:hypothetical protein
MKFVVFEVCGDDQEENHAYLNRAHQDRSRFMPAYLIVELGIRSMCDRDRALTCGVQVAEEHRISCKCSCPQNAGLTATICVKA